MYPMNILASQLRKLLPELTADHLHSLVSSDVCVFKSHFGNSLMCCVDLFPSGHRRARSICKTT